MNLPEELLEKLDAYCQKNFTNRTELIKRLLLEFLRKQEESID
jgi:metal-responsive CopG/Arc/MetJ family transcriptional regulator